MRGTIAQANEHSIRKNKRNFTINTIGLVNRNSLIKSFAWIVAVSVVETRTKFELDTRKIEYFEK